MEEGRGDEEERGDGKGGYRLKWMLSKRSVK